MAAARIAIVKPDHLGDMVLASPAINAIRSHYSDVTLFVAPATIQLSSAIFPEVKTKPLVLGHLNKNPRIRNFTDDEILSALKDFDFTVFLRDDLVLQELYPKLARPFARYQMNPHQHETQKQRTAAQQLVGYYDIEAHFPFRGRQATWPANPRKIGLSISAGFVTNRLANGFWIDIARKLISRGYQIQFIGGPAEKRDIELICKFIKPSVEPLIGSSDFATFWSQCAELDLVIGTDSGTLHICSLSTPVMGLYTSSAWWNFSPIGRWNRIYSKNLPCAPCVQFSHSALNGCLTRECAAIDPQDILDAIGAS